jgi:hypothetical protein
MLVTNPALGFREGRPKNCSIYVVGFWGRFSRQGQRKINERSLLELVIGNFNSLMSQKKSLFLLASMVPQKRLSIVNRAACPAAPRMCETQTLRISLLNSLLAGKYSEREVRSRLPAPPEVSQIIDFGL